MDLFRRYSLLLLCLVFSVNCTTYDPITPSSEKRLIKQLIGNYEKAGKIGRPIKNTKDIIVVGYGLSLFQLLDLDEKNQILSVNVWAKYTWVDQLLRWDPANYSNIREVRIPPRHIWTPDIALYNFVDERSKELRDVMLNVDYLGRVFWSPPAIFKSNCHIEIRNFPFDHQLCYLQFGSRTLFTDQLDLQFLDNRTEVDIDQYTTSNEWTLLARPAHRYIMMSEQCGRTITYLTFFLFLKRNPAFYAYLLVLPCVLLSLITTSIFWLPPHVPAKTLLGMNIFVAISLLLKILSSSTPSASVSIPYLGYYYCLNLILLSTSTFLSTVVINLFTYTHRHREVPPWLTKVVRILATPLSISPPEEDDRLNLMSPLPMDTSQLRKCEQVGLDPRVFMTPFHPFTCRMDDKHEQYSRMRQGIPIPEWTSNRPYEWDVKHRNSMNDRSHEHAGSTGVQWSQHSTPELALDNKMPTVNRVVVEPDSNDSGVSDGTATMKMPSRRADTKRPTVEIHTNLSDLYCALRQLMEKIGKKGVAQKRERNWRLVVMTIDRTFFWLYLIIIITTGSYLLFPRGQTHSIDEVIKMHASEYTRRNREVAAECLLSQLQMKGYEGGL